MTELRVARPSGISPVDVRIVDGNWSEIGQTPVTGLLEVYGMFVTSRENSDPVLLLKISNSALRLSSDLGNRRKPFGRTHFGYEL